MANRLTCIAISLLSLLTLIADHACAQNEALAQELAQMVEADQAAIQLAIQAANAQERTLANDRKDELLRKHTKRLKAIFAESGFPGIEEVGSEGSHSFWLLVQHSDHDVDFQSAVLAKMKAEVDRKNANADNFAYLSDRVAKNTDRPQRYGTQVGYTERGQAVPFPIEDSFSVNERQTAIGLDPIEQYLNEMSELHFQMNRQLMETTKQRYTKITRSKFKPC